MRKKLNKYLVMLFLLTFCLFLSFLYAATGEKIVFVSNRDYGVTNDLNYNEIYVMDPDGNNPVRLTTNNYYDGEPCWTSEGQIVFESWRDNNHEVYIMDGDGQNQLNLSNNAASDGEPSVSPDGTKIAFSSDRSGSYEIWVMNLDGTGATQLTSNGGNYQPAWSPDGTKIAYESSGDIYVMNASDGAGRVQLTDHSAQDTCPVWSPDGTKIAFVTYRDANWEIYTMSATDGSSLLNISYSNLDDFNPCWSPEGSVLAYQSFKDGRNEIYRMYPDGTLQTRITFKNGANSSPAWLGEIIHDNWSTVRPSVAKRFFHGVATGSDGKVYAVGGCTNYYGSPLSTAEAYNPSTNTWETITTNMPLARCYTTAVALNNDIYQIGGYNAGYVATVYKYNITNQTWTSVAPLKGTRGGASATVWDGKIYVGGGYGSGGYYNTFEVYDPDLDTWEYIPSMTTKRTGLGVVAVDGKIYAIGGCQGGTLNAAVATVEAFDIATQEWTTKRPMPNARCAFGIAVYNNKIYVFGGINGSILYNTVLVYDPATDSWETKTTTMPTTKFGFGAAVVGSNIYLVNGKVSGGLTGGVSINTVDKYIP